MITIQLNGKTREISLEEFLDRDIQDILGDDIGIDTDALSDFHSDLPDDISEFIKKD